MKNKITEFLSCHLVAVIPTELRRFFSSSVVSLPSPSLSASLNNCFICNNILPTSSSHRACQLPHPSPSSPPSCPGCGSWTRSPSWLPGSGWLWLLGCQAGRITDWRFWADITYYTIGHFVGSPTHNIFTIPYTNVLYNFPKFELNFWHGGWSFIQSSRETHNWVAIICPSEKVSSIRNLVERKNSLRIWKI